MGEGLLDTGGGETVGGAVSLKEDLYPSAAEAVLLRGRGRMAYSVLSLVV